MTSAMTQKYRG